MNEAMAASLLNLPVEILDQITDYLNDEVLVTLRLTCKALYAAIFDRFCDVYIAHLGCWMISKDRWERLYNLLSASSKLLSEKVRTITLTMEELELRTADDFVSVCGFPSGKEDWSADHLREIWMERYYNAEYNIAMEAGAIERRGAADLAVMVRVFEQARLHGCSIRLDLAPAHPLANRKPPLHPQAKEIQIHLQHGIAQVRPRIEVISLDRPRHACLEETLIGNADAVNECFAGLREFTLTPLKGDLKRKHKNQKSEVAKTVLASAQHLQKLYFFVCGSLIGGGHERAQRWATDLLLSNRLDALESLTLLYVPLPLEDLLEILRRCSGTLTYLELRFDPKAPSGEAWLTVWEQLASMDKLRRLKLERPKTWRQDCDQVRIFRSAGYCETTDRKRKFVDRGEVMQGLARIIEAELSHA